MAIPILLEILAILDFLVPVPSTRSVQDPDYAEYKKEILAQIAARLESPLTTEGIRERLLQELRARRDYPNDILDFLLLQGTKTIQLELDREKKSFERCHLWVVAELRSQCILIKDQREECGIEAEDGNEGNNLQAVHARNADLDSENAKHNGMTPYYQTILYLVPKALALPIVPRPPFLQRRS
ncbi:unnamed protein product [Alternaria alternata]